jgi:hypothetical protein
MKVLRGGVIPPSRNVFVCAMAEGTKREGANVG